MNSQKITGKCRIRSQKCCRCRKKKVLSEFWPSTNRCKDCCRSYRNAPGSKEKRNKAAREWYKNNRDHAIREARLWRSKNREHYRKWQKDYTQRRRRETKDWRLRRSYGITADQYDAMLRNQFGRCAICRCSLLREGRSAQAVDHCHQSGTVRGILCSRCNLSIGGLKHSISILLSAASYLFAAVSKESLMTSPILITRRERDMLKSIPLDT